MVSQTERLAPGRTRTWLEITRTCGCDDPRSVDRFGRWLLIARACVLPMTLTSIAIAGILAAGAPGFEAGLFALAAVGSLAAHAANNVMNDLFDLSSGLDTEDYPRAQYAPHPVLAGLIDRRGLMRTALALNAIDAAIMVALVVLRGPWILAFAVSGLILSVGYVAPPLRLKARGLGEPSVLLIWGPVMVGGMFYAATGHLTAATLWTSVPYGLLATSVLMGKHIDKLPWDREAGIATLPVLLGEARARTVTVVLIAAFYVATLVLVATGTITPWAAVVVVGLGTFAKTRRTFGRPRPDQPPPRYPIWPLWYGPWAFVHARLAGSLFVAGLLAGALWEISV